ncbi:MAG TPA: Xaa-Pro peptidase family protein [Anaerolineae bacterium]
MHTEQRARAHELLRSRSIDRALFAAPASVTWLTGFAPPIQTGANPFAGGPPLVWYESGEFTLIVMDWFSSQAVPVINYPGYTYESPIASADHLAAIVRSLVGRSRAGTLGVEARHLPAFLAPSDAVSIDGLLDPLRAVKTADEIETLRRCFALADAGHAAAREATRAGKREIDVWAVIQSAISRAAGQRVPLGNDCVVSRRENNIGGWPGDFELRPGDSLIVDLGARLNGYWSDSCAVYYASEPSDRQRATHNVVRQALEYAISLIKPGAVANEVDRKVRQFIADAGYPVYPHHTGHSVGVSPHEEPRLTPYNTLLLQPGMVVMLEPGSYIPGEIAVRLEDAVLVTADGAEVLTRHNKGLP